MQVQVFTEVHVRVRINYYEAVAHRHLVWVCLNYFGQYLAFNYFLDVLKFKLRHKRNFPQQRSRKAIITAGVACLQIQLAHNESIPPVCPVFAYQCAAFRSSLAYAPEYPVFIHDRFSFTLKIENVRP